MSGTRPEPVVSPQTSSHSPRKAGRDSTKLYGATIDEVAKARRDIAVEMSGYFVGPMPVKDFLAEFLPLPAGVREDDSELAKVFGCMKKATEDERRKKAETSNVSEGDTASKELPRMAPAKVRETSLRGESTGDAPEGGTTHNLSNTNDAFPTTEQSQDVMPIISVSRGKEAKMWSEFLSCVQPCVDGKRVHRFSALRFCDTSHKRDPEDEDEFQPDISVYTDKDPVDLDRTCWERVQLVIELKAEIKDDPFDDNVKSRGREGGNATSGSVSSQAVANDVESARFSGFPVESRLSRSQSYNKMSGQPNPYPFERNSDEGTWSRAQLVQYASMMWANQPRVFLFQVILFKDCARLLRCDRAGAIVSERFHYQNTAFLAQFLSRFNAMPHTQRGEDATVTSATDDETERAKAILDKDDIERNERMLKIVVSDKTGDKELIVSRRRFIYPTAIGRGTRCYVAADLSTGDRVFLKDSWRYDVDRMRLEGEIYELLNKQGVSNIAKVVYHGDVKEQEGRTDQRSITALYADNRGSHGWRFKAVLASVLRFVFDL